MTIVLLRPTVIGMRADPDGPEVTFVLLRLTIIGMRADMDRK